MPRFYIDFRNGNEIAKDIVGVDLPGLEEAKAAAVGSGREILAENVKHASPNPLTEVIISDQSGTPLAAIAAKDILPEPLK